MGCLWQALHPTFLWLLRGRPRCLELIREGGRWNSFKGLCVLDNNKLVRMETKPSTPWVVLVPGYQIMLAGSWLIRS